MADYEFTMPWPPSVNHWHQPCRGRIIKGSAARYYEHAAVNYLMNIGVAGERIESQLSVSIVLMPPTNARYDIDNRTKGIFDSLSAACFWVDDSQVKKLTIEKGNKVKGGLVSIAINVI